MGALEPRVVVRLFMKGRMLEMKAGGPLAEASVSKGTVELSVEVGAAVEVSAEVGAAVEVSAPEATTVELSVEKATVEVGTENFD